MFRKAESTHVSVDGASGLFPEASALSGAAHARLSPDRREALTRFLARVREAGLPEPELHGGDGQPVELLWREHKLVVRVDDII
jgi:hypothetical protein